MKNFKLTFVLMAGLPGTGKSTLAYVLGHELDWHVIDKDKYKEEFVSQGIEDAGASEKAYQQSFAIARDRLSKQQTSVILDSAALYRFILDNAMDIVCDLENVQLKIILCVASYDLRKERIEKRKFHPSKVGVGPSAIIDSDYRQYFSHLPSNTLILDTSRSIADCVAKAKDYLAS